MLLLLKLVHDFVDFEHFTVPFLLIEGLGEEGRDHKLRQHFKRCVDHLVVDLLDLLESEAAMQSSHCLLAFFV